MGEFTTFELLVEQTKALAKMYNMPVHGARNLESVKIEAICSLIDEVKQEYNQRITALEIKMEEMSNDTNPTN